MTGYAQASAGSSRGTLTLELRSVNARFLDLAFRIPDELRMLEPVLRERMAGRLGRGKVDCRLSIAAAAAEAKPQLNAQALGQLKALAQAAAKAFPKAEPLRIADVLRWPGVIAEAADEAGLRATVEELARRALDEFVAARAREGAKLAAAVVERVRAMRARVDEVQPLLPQAIAAYQEKITERLKEAIGSALGDGFDERVRAEIALFGTRVDVAEEIDRLRAHLDEVENVLRKGGPVGKRLDFLAQELNREANTLASKAASAAISDAALELKLLVEQIREQVQNLE
jgi:uncharacterized protein (TIGR00255 family)